MIDEMLKPGCYAMMISMGNEKRQFICYEFNAKSCHWERFVTIKEEMKQYENKVNRVFSSVLKKWPFECLLKMECQTWTLFHFWCILIGRKMTNMHLILIWLSPTFWRIMLMQPLDSKRDKSNKFVMLLNVYIILYSFSVYQNDNYIYQSFAAWMML